MLSEEVTMIVNFYGKICNILKDHKSKNQYIDDLCDDTLADALDDYKDDNKVIENKMDDLNKLLRESPSLEECDKRFADCLDLLNQIEQFYRDYLSKVLGISRQHPVDGRNECDNYQLSVCKLYEIFPKDKELPQIEVPKPLYVIIYL